MENIHEDYDWAIRQLAEIGIIIPRLKIHRIPPVDGSFAQPSIFNIDVCKSASGEWGSTISYAGPSFRMTVDGESEKAKFEVVRPGDDPRWDGLEERRVWTGPIEPRDSLEIVTG